MKTFSASKGRSFKYWVETSDRRTVSIFGSRAVTDKRGWGLEYKSQFDLACGALAMCQPAWLAVYGGRRGPHFKVLVKKPFGITLRRHKVRWTPFSEWPKMAALLFQPGGKSSQLNVKVTKRERENTVPCDTRVVVWATREGVSFCEGACGAWYPGRKSS